MKNNIKIGVILVLLIALLCIFTVIMISYLNNITDNTDIQATITLLSYCAVLGIIYLVYSCINSRRK